MKDHNQEKYMLINVIGRRHMESYLDIFQVFTFGKTLIAINTVSLLLEYWHYTFYILQHACCPYFPSPHNFL